MKTCLGEVSCSGSPTSRRVIAALLGSAALASSALAQDVTYAPPRLLAHPELFRTGASVPANPWPGFEPRGVAVLYSCIAGGPIYYNVSSADGPAPADANRVLYDDIMVPAARLNSFGHIDVCRVTVAIYRNAGAPATDASVYWTPLTTGVTPPDTAIDIPATLVGTQSLGAATVTGNQLVTFGMAGGPTIFSVPLNMNLITDAVGTPGSFGSFAIGLKLSSTSTSQGWRNVNQGTAGSDINANVFWIHDPNVTGQPNPEGAWLFSNTPNGTGAAPFASFYAVVQGIPVVGSATPTVCCLSNASGQGCFVASSASRCATSGGSVVAGTACTPNPCITFKCCNQITGACTVVNSAAACAAPDFAIGALNSTCASGAPTCPTINPPANDNCTPTEPPVLVVDDPALTDQQLFGATASFTPIPADCTASELDVWYKFDSPASGNLHLQVVADSNPTTPTLTQETLSISIFSGCGTGQIACVGAVSPNAAVDFQAAPATTHYVRIAGFDASSRFSVQVRRITIFTCCNPTTAACTLSGITGTCASAGDTVGTIEGQACTPNPCPGVPCCNTTSGACTFVGTQAVCTTSGGLVPGSSTSCTPEPCRVACCNAVSGACALSTGFPAFGCATGFTAGLLGTSCSPNLCPPAPTPANDDCFTVAQLAADNIAPFANGVSTNSGTLFGATIDTPSGSCAQPAAGGGPGGGVWYRFTVPGTGAKTYALSLCTGTPATLDTVMALFSDCNTQLPATPNFSCDDDKCALFGPSRIDQYILTGGQTVLILIANYGAASLPESFVLNIVGLGACCDAASGICTQIVGGANAGCGASLTFQGVGTTCTPNPCPQPQGACCLFSGSCVTESATGCATAMGTFLGVNSSCIPIANCVSQACCTGTVCSIAYPSICISGGGTVQAGISCSPDPCAPASGVCCRGSTCVVDAGLQSQATCAATITGTAGATFVATGPCGGTNHLVPCCHADYNKIGGRNVTDIFAFLTDWFAARPWAIVGGNGTGTPGVSHIFAFLTDWFAGGCP